METLSSSSIDLKTVSGSLRDSVFWGNTLGYITFKRTYARLLNEDDPNSSTEEWSDMNNRIINALLTLGLEINEFEKKELFDLFVNQKCSLAGTATVLKRGILSLQNCACCVVNEPVEPFCWTMEALMLGVGVGFNIQKQYVDHLPPPKYCIASRCDRYDSDYIVPDKREGWVRLLREVLTAHFVTGKSFSYSTKCIRSKGAPLKTFGGTASGPDVLCEGIAKIQRVINHRVGLKMRPIDCLDIMNIIAEIVCAGNIRRSAQIALGDPDDIEFLHAKRWDLSSSIPNWRSFSNNSVICNDINKLPKEFWELYSGNSEPYGLINLQLSRGCGRLGETKYPDPDLIGYNPCGEQGLCNMETCCLAEIFLPHIRSTEELWTCTQYLYRICKHSLSLPATGQTFQKTNEIVHSNMRIGISISGYLMATAEQRGWLSQNYERLRQFDVSYSLEHNFPPSIKLTTVKPSGTLSLLANVTPGVHPGFARHFIRRVRIAADSPLIKLCKEMGFHCEYQREFDKSLNHRIMVVDFPCSYPDHAVLAKDVTAIRQLEYVRELQTNWSDNSVSVTVYYHENELEDIKKWLRDNYNTSIKSVSFLLHSEHGFDQAPYEEITQHEFDEMVNRCKTIQDNSLNNSFKHEDILDSFECATGVCPVR